MLLPCRDNTRISTPCSWVNIGGPKTAILYQVGQFYFDDTGQSYIGANNDVPLPAISTVHAALDRNGLVNHSRPRRYKAEGTALSIPTEPNDLWCADYKGEFMLADGRYCYPLTVTDFASRYLIGCEALSNTRTQYAVTVFERLFREYGLPKSIRTDNGIPFASGWALFGLTTLSV